MNAAAVVPSAKKKLQSYSRAFPKHDDVLLRQSADGFHPVERVKVHFLAHLHLGHFVNPLDRHVRIFPAKLHEYNAPARLSLPRPETVSFVSLAFERPKPIVAAWH
jgi:hypothetical protein